MKASVTITMSLYNPIETIKKLNQTNMDYLHIDVMDGEFVNQKLFPFKEVKKFIKFNKKPLDIHLMVEKPKRDILKFAKLKPKIITIHYEIKEDKVKLLKLIKSLNIKPGLSIKPGTKVDEIKDLLPYVSHALIMTVEPGQGGQKFITEMIPKIQELKNLRKELSLDFTISVDGGINESTTQLVKDVDIISVGSYVCMSNDYQNRIDKIKSIS